MGKSIWDTRFGKRGIAQDERVQVEEGDSWKTIHGAHVLLGDDGRIKAGAGGKFNGNKLASYKNTLPQENLNIENAEWLESHKNTLREMKNNAVSKTRIPFQPKESAIAAIKEFSQMSHDYVEKFEYPNPPNSLTEPMSEDKAIAEIAGGDQTGGSCASAAMAFVANQELGLDVRDFRGGVSRMVMSSNHEAALVEVSESDYSPRKEGGKIFFSTPTNPRAACAEALKALDSMKPGKNYVANFGNHVAMTRKLDSGEIQYLELQSRYSEKNGWRTLVDRKENYQENQREFAAQQVLMERFKVYGCATTTAHGVIPADRYAKTDYVKNNLQYVNTSEKRQMKGSGGSIK